jgi:hypothetical protein
VDEKSAIERGISAFIKKPIHANELLEQILMTTTPPAESNKETAY